MLAGLNHFIDHAFYLKIMPPYLPWHLLLVYLSGLLEIALGILLLIPKFTHIAAWGLIALLIAVFPANIHMAVNHELFPEYRAMTLWLRLPLQVVLMAFSYWYTLAVGPERDGPLPDPGAVLTSILMPLPAREYMRDARKTSQLNLSFEIHGTGNPILFLHGLGASIYSWRYLVPLAEQHQLIFIDLKGFGASPKPLDKPYSAQDQADLIHEFIVRHDLRNLVVVGHSFGGGVALLTALKLSGERSDRLSGLVLIDSAGYKQHLPGYINVLRTPILGPLLLDLLSSERQARSILRLAYYDRSKITREQVAAYAAPIDSPGGRHALVQTANQIIPPNIEEITSHYKNISVPTLILWGRQDRIVPLKIAQQLDVAITNSRLVILESCGHIPQEEKPTETIGIIAGFLMALNKPT